MIEEMLVQELITERRRDRRWRNIRWGSYICLLLLFVVSFYLCVSNLFPPDTSAAISAKEPYVALIRMEGVILPGTDFSAQKVIPQLNGAFRDKGAKGVVLLINSPGGSPVQSSIIHDKIMALKKEYNKTVIVVGEDTLASGSYLIATAADKIYVNQDTLTGSIGVIMAGFGASEAIEKIGVQRRVFTAGANKDRLDMFEPLKPADVTKIKSVLDDVHQSFIDYVLASRKDKLSGDKKELFSGDFWTGSQATKLGLVDGTANLWEVLKKEFDVTYYRDYSVKESFLSSILGNMGTQLHLGFSQQLQKRLDAEL